VLEGKIALVTGASRGIGHAIAGELAKQGATVFGTATSAEGAAKVPGTGKVLDVKNAEACDALVKEIGDVAILVNNAGITRDNLALRLKDADWDEVMDTNMKAVFRLSRAVMRGMMKARWGRIINITSIVGSSGNAGQANYAAAKAGIQGLTKTLAIELGRFGIRANCVAPGFIATAMTAQTAERIGMDFEAFQEAAAEQTPLRRIGQPEDVAGVIAFLCSDDAAHVSGQVIYVRGGP
jgi:3-oxoacyl-[acyl-carrier protein] reductase